MTYWFAKEGATGGDGSSDHPFGDLATATSHMSNGDTLVGAGKFRETLTPVDGCYYEQWNGESQFIIDGSDVVTGWTGPDGNGEYYASWTVDPKVVFQDDVKLTRGTVGSLASGEWGWDGTNSRIYVKDDPTGHTMEAGKREINIDGQSGIGFSIIGLHARRAYSKGFDIRTLTGNTVTLSNARVEDVGSWAYFIYQATGRGGTTTLNGCEEYGSGTYSAYIFYCYEGIISINALSAEKDCRISHAGGANIDITGFDSLAGYRPFYIDSQSGGTISISNCTVTNPSSYGIYITGQSGGTVTVDGNEVSGAGSYGIYLSSVTGGTLHTTRNEVDGGIRPIYANGVDGSVVDFLVACNIFKNGSWDNGTINNSPGAKIYRNTSVSGSGGMQFSSDCTNAKVKGNLIYNQSSYEINYVSGTTTTGLEADYANFYTSSGIHLKWTDGNTYTTLASWQSATGQDAHSISDDPMFLDPGNGDFHLTEDSPCIDAGTTLTGAPDTDMDGRPANQGAGPDIGCYEFPGTFLKEHVQGLSPSFSKELDLSPNLEAEE